MPPPDLKMNALSSCESAADALTYKTGMESPVEGRCSADDSYCVDVTAVGRLNDPPSTMVGFLLPGQMSDAAIGGEEPAAASGRTLVKRTGLRLV